MVEMAGLYRKEKRGKGGPWAGHVSGRGSAEKSSEGQDAGRAQTL